MSDTQKKKRMVYSFALKKNDSPFVQEFIENQSNFSETLRYLIYSYVAEYGTDDISYKFYELLFNNAGSPNLSNIGNAPNSNKNVIVNDKVNSEVSDNAVDLDTSANNDDIKNDISADVDDDNSNNDDDLDDDIPDCYK